MCEAGEKQARLVGEASPSSRRAACAQCFGAEAWRAAASATAATMAATLGCVKQYSICSAARPSQR
jgi:hypothetical protein